MLLIDEYMYNVLYLTYIVLLRGGTPPWVQINSNERVVKHLVGH